MHSSLLALGATRASGDVVGDVVARHATHAHPPAWIVAFSGASRWEGVADDIESLILGKKQNTGIMHNSYFRDMPAP